MAHKEVPAKSVFTCDCCGEVAETKVQATRPVGWAKLVLHRDILNRHGVPSADGSICRHLCKPCTEVTINAINSVKCERI